MSYDVFIIKNKTFHKLNNVIKEDFNETEWQLKIKKEQFEANKALSIVNIWVGAAQSVMGWWASFASMGIPGIVLAGVMTAATLAMAGVQTGLVASQTFHGAEGGVQKAGNIAGDNALTWMNKGEALVKDQDYRLFVNGLKNGGGGQGNVYNFYGNIVTQNAEEFVYQMNEISRKERGRR